MPQPPEELRAALEGLRGLGGDALLNQMVTVFVDYSADRLRALDAALASGDLTGAGAAGHALKGSARQLGLAAMADACLGVETASKAGDLPAAQTHAAAVHSTYTTAVEWLKSATA